MAKSFVTYPGTSCSSRLCYGVVVIAALIAVAAGAEVLHNPRIRPAVEAKVPHALSAAAPVCTWNRANDRDRCFVQRQAQPTVLRRAMATESKVLHARVRLHESSGRMACSKVRMQISLPFGINHNDTVLCALTGLCLSIKLNISEVF
nr:hypothetical protein CFP56_33474 [Quercus suber]